jgi:hypothetical protein
MHGLSAETKQSLSFHHPKQSNLSLPLTPQPHATPTPAVASLLCFNFPSTFAAFFTQ